jgi:hypothetical protein
MSFLPDPSEQQEPSLSGQEAVEERDAGDDYFIAKTYGYLLAALAGMTLTGVGRTTTCREVGSGHFPRPMPDVAPSS